MIILVVLGHTWRGLYNQNLLPQDVFEALDSRIYAFHMPVFFALAGWFFVSALSGRSLFQFVMSRLQRLLWPMILWTYIFFGIKVLAGDFANTPLQNLEFLTSPLPPKAHFWFLWALLLISLFLIWMKPFVKNGRASGPLLVATALVLLAVDTMTVSAGLFQWIGGAIKYVNFFFLGMVLSQMRGNAPSSAPWSGIAAVSFCVLVFYWPDIKGSDWEKPARLGLTFCVLIAMSGAGTVLTQKMMQTLCWLGAGSMAIYLSHTIFSAGLREALLAAGVDIIAVHVLLSTLIGLLAPLFLLWLAQRTKTEKLLGF